MFDRGDCLQGCAAPEAALHHVLRHLGLAVCDVRLAGPLALLAPHDAELVHDALYLFAAPHDVLFTL